MLCTARPTPPFFIFTTCIVDELSRRLLYLSILLSLVSSTSSLVDSFISCSTSCSPLSGRSSQACYSTSSLLLNLIPPSWPSALFYCTAFARTIMLRITALSLSSSRTILLRTTAHYSSLSCALLRSFLYTFTAQYCAFLYYIYEYIGS